MLSDNVSIVKMNSKSINIQRQSIVHKVAQTEQSQGYHSYVKIKSIKYIGTEDVYNMEVKDHHNFAVCGGLIVHNCMDAMRYGTERFQRGNTFSFD